MGYHDGGNAGGDTYRPRKSYGTNRDDRRRNDRGGFKPRNDFRNDRNNDRPYRNDRGHGNYQDRRFDKPRNDRGGFKPRNDFRNDRKPRQDRPWIDLVALEARVTALEKLAGVETPSEKKEEVPSNENLELLIDAVKEFYAAVKNDEMDVDMAEEIVSGLEKNGISIRDPEDIDEDEDEDDDIDEFEESDDDIEEEEED